MDIERLKELQQGVSSIVYIALSKLTDKNARANTVKFGNDLQALIDEAIARQSEEEKMVTCPDCGGSGVYQEYDEYDRYYVHACGKCEGSGEVGQATRKRGLSDEQ